MSSIGTPPLPPSNNEVGPDCEEQMPTGPDDDDASIDDGDPHGPFETSEKSQISERTSADYEPDADHPTEPDAEDGPSSHTAATQTDDCDDTVVVNEDETNFPEFLYAREDLTSKGSLDGDPDPPVNQPTTNNSNLPVGIQEIEEPTSVEVGCQTDPERDSIMKRLMSALPWVQTREPDFAVVSISNPFDDFRAPSVQQNGPRAKQQKTVTTTTKYETRDCCQCNIL